MKTVKIAKTATFTLTASLWMTCFAAAQNEVGTGDDQGTRPRAESMQLREEVAEEQRVAPVAGQGREQVSGGFREKEESAENHPRSGDEQQAAIVRLPIEEGEGEGPLDPDGEGSANPIRIEEREESAGEGDADTRSLAEGSRRGETEERASLEDPDGEGSARAGAAFAGRLRADVFSFEARDLEQQQGTLAVLLVAPSPQLMSYEGKEILALGHPRAAGSTDDDGIWKYDEIVDARPDADIWFQIVLVDEDGGLRVSPVLYYEAKEEVVPGSGPTDEEAELIGQPLASTWPEEIAGHEG